MNRQPDTLTWRERLGYGSGDYALNLFWQGIGYYLLFYFTDVLGIDNTTAGLIFAIGGFWDAITDPVMGYLAERAKNRGNLYRPWLLFGSVPLGISGALLFFPPLVDDGAGRAWYVLASLLVFQTCYTIVSIPYSALGARLTRDSKERTRISGVRMYCGFLGGISVIGIASLLQSLYSDKTAFALLGAICGALSIGTLLWCHANTTVTTRFKTIGKQADDPREVIGSLLTNRPFVLLLCALVLVTVGATALHKNMLYYFEYGLGNRMAGNLAIFTMTSAPLLTIPAWSAIALKAGKRNSWIIGSLVGITGFLLLYIDNSGSIPLAIAETTLITIGLSSYAVLLWSMLPDTIDFGEYKSGIRNESAGIGILSSAQKAALAGTAFMIGFFLDHFGYQAGQTQSSETLQGLKYMVSLWPAGALLLSLLLIYRYPLSSAVLEELRTSRLD